MGGWDGLASNRHKFRVDRSDVVKRAMVEQGYRWRRALAEEIGCNRFSLSRALNGKERSLDHFDACREICPSVLGLEVELDFMQGG